MATPTPTHNTTEGPPLRIGVFGGSFNPIHLGHALLAITTQQTQPVDVVVLVPVFKHPWKTDLLPFDDRVNMCRLAVAPFIGSGTIQVSRVEEKVGASNGAMLQALKKDYPSNSTFFWICGDDFFRWMEDDKGIETLNEVNGLIVQRRLHKSASASQTFFKEPLDEQRVRSFAARLGLTIDFIYGELPHFSSTLVRRAPGHWKSFLPQSVSAYLEERPHLLEQLMVNLEKDSLREQEGQQRQHQTIEADTNNETTTTESSQAASWVMRGLELVHALQFERGFSGLQLSLGKGHAKVAAYQAATDDVLQGILEQDVSSLEDSEGWEEVLGLALELKQVPIWLQRDRKVLQRRCDALLQMEGIEGWMARLALVKKFNPRIDVLLLGLLRALTEIRNRNANNNRTENERDLMPELLWKWSKAKEALGRLRAFVCAGGPQAPLIVSQSVEMRERLHECIQEKDRRMARVFLEQHATTTVPDALHSLLEDVTSWEWTLMRCFASSTPLTLVHKLLSKNTASTRPFEVEQFFEASTTAIDFLLTFTKALAASACAGGKLNESNPN